ncbi:MAG: FAD-binding protein [Candidatus Helarchaeota archaeon]
MSIKIDRENCTGCGSCINSCLYGGITLFDGKAKLIPEKCILCGACVEACPVGAIIIKDEKKEKKIDISQYKGVWIIGEHYNNKIKNYVYQLLGKGRELADKLKVELTIILLGSELDENLEELGMYGADRVIYVKSPLLRNYYSEIYVNVITDLIIEYKPEIVLVGATPIGRDFAPRISKRLQTGLTADCTGLDIDQETRNLLLQTRPTFGGNIMATIRTPNSRPQMSTIRPGMFKVPKKMDKKPKIKIIEGKFKESDISTNIVKIIKRGKKRINLEEAQIVVAGGRGIGSKENFKIIKDLAKELNAEVAGSRVAVELGWIDPERQVGQTGKTISPRLYIACGISGAIQHKVGILCSDIIVAINKDPNAPIFEIAHYGIVGDLHKVVPAITREIRRLKEEEKVRKY